jgi:hypothetical protein
MIKWTKERTFAEFVVDLETVDLNQLNEAGIEWIKKLAEVARFLDDWFRDVTINGPRDESWSERMEAEWCIEWFRTITHKALTPRCASRTRLFTRRIVSDSPCSN